MFARKMDSFFREKLKLPQKVRPYCSLFWPFLTAKSWLRVLFLYPFRMFLTWLPSDVLATHVKCLSSAQNPPGSSRDTQYKLKSCSLPGLHDLALSENILLTLLFSLSGLLTVPQQAGQTPTRGLCMYSSFACNALLELYLCPSLQGFS